MKKNISVIMVIAILLCFSCCNSLKDTTVSSDITSDISIISSEGTIITSSESISSDVATEASNNMSSTVSNIDSSSKQPSSSVQQSSSNTQPTVTEKTKPNFGNGLTNSILDLKNQVPYYSFDLPGVMVDYMADEDLIYIICRNKNQINLYDGNTGKVVYSHSLPGRPAELHMYGDELWISFPELNCINVYSKADFKALRSIEELFNVFSFDVYKNIIFYAGEEREQLIWRYDITTKSKEYVLGKIGSIGNWDEMLGFYEPAVLVDEDNATLYIAETNLTGCKLFYYNIETLEQIDVFDTVPFGVPNYGFLNYNSRKMILLDGYVYWNSFKFNPKSCNAEQFYTNDERGGNGILYADKDYVATYEGVFENKTGNRIITFESRWNPNINRNTKFAITKSKNMMFSSSNTLYVFCG
ncbi:MAG: hypothetical protein E7480_00140 [Ruminococcaceae bacterium]|nr:hypothetical protein [Oscillospiraceae bacterium]